MKLLVIFMDALEPELVEKMDLPNIKKYGARKYRCTIANTGPQMASFLTGLPPGEHGITELHATSTRFSVKGKMIWEKISSSIGIMNVPLTYPPPMEMNGWLVCGVDSTPGAIYTYPRDLWKELDTMDYVIHPMMNREKNTYAFWPAEQRGPLWTHKVSIEKWWDAIDTRFNAFEYLIEKHPVDIAVLGLTVLDFVCHYCWDNKKTVEHFYKIVDEAIGKIIDKAKAQYVLLFSDHGCIASTGGLKGVHGPFGFWSANFECKVETMEDVHNIIVEMGNDREKELIERRLKELGYA